MFLVTFCQHLRTFSYFLSLFLAYLAYGINQQRKYHIRITKLVRMLLCGNMLITSLPIFKKASLFPLSTASTGIKACVISV